MNGEAEEDDAEEEEDEEEDNYEDNDKDDFHRRSERGETKRGRTRAQGRTRSLLKVGRHQPKKDEDEDTMRARGGKPKSRMRT